MVPHLVDEWLLCRRWLVPAIAVGDLSEDIVFGRVSSGLAQLWRGERSAMVTQLENGDVRRLHVLLGGGDLRELIAMHFGVAAWGRVMGADFATINGRRGWSRALLRHGFELRDGELWKALR